ncbi:cytochrome c oxidase subunit 3 family protein [uncultured Sunxiuqinia sp.]|mgnify:CR=1 FL=1|uniref:cytochrome c oxidase subunit 3 family protein n=1 Tax=uncultured Sunxiuqinia sp. TaxID=1573825 RepID=UPI0019CB5E68|nr:cytochrome c oxidase subunit 3 family protein [Sunxiuqinia sp.]|tara:strand:+ start:49172 stop:49789 length:618 start_codon:yes stop_codon:yes gene_type:complete
MSQVIQHDEHYDPEGSKIGMWLFIFTELLLFGGLFIVYSVYRYMNADAFHLAAEELNTTVGALNTVILLVSSMTIAMSTTALQKKQKATTIVLLEITFMLALIFLVNKYFEWGVKFDHGIFPGSEFMKAEMSQGEVLFFGLYFVMTGLHALHIIAGLVIMGFALARIKKGTVHADRPSLLENAGLYWHLVDLIWIFLFPLFYLIT